jgi:PAS domain-containing protein
MADATEASGHKGRLHGEAAERLRRASAPGAIGGAIGVDALTLLYRLASSPKSAGDAIKLLHELQVHQVELDLQREQLRSNDLEATRNLARFRSFYELAPLGLFVLDNNGYVISANSAGAELIDTDPAVVSGHRFDSFLASEGLMTMTRLLHRLREGHASATGIAPTRGHGASSRLLTISAWVSPCRAALLLIVSTQDPPAST